jgi:small subunit ribosomal protein S6
MIILDAQLEDDIIRAATDRAVDMIRNGGAEDVRVERWGRRRFAYELKHRWEGFYVLVSASAEPSTMADLDRALHLADEVIRHKIIRLPEAAAAASTTAAPAAAPEPAAAQ